MSDKLNSKTIFTNKGFDSLMKKVVKIKPTIKKSKSKALKQKK